MNRTRLAERVLWTLMTLLLSSVPSLAAATAEAGRIIAEENCASCHSIGRVGKSTHQDAPAFRDLSQRYPIDNLAEAFAEGLNVGHADMPEFTLTAEQTQALLSYLQSIQDTGRR